MIYSAVTRTAFLKLRWAPRGRAMTSVASQEGGLSDPNGYCKDLVRKRDLEAFLASQLYPRELQNSFYALRAFDVSGACSTSIEHR